MFLNESNNLGIFSEAGGIFASLAEGAGDIMDGLGSLFKTVFGTVTHASTSVVKEISDGARGVIRDAGGLLSAALPQMITVINNGVQWIVIIALALSIFRQQLIPQPVQEMVRPKYF